MKLQRAYSLFEIKSFDDEKRIIEGIATTPEPDRAGDIVEPKGAEFQLPIPFLWQHDAGRPIGHVTDAKVSAEGIRVKVQLVKVEEPGALKDRLDEAWQSVKSGLVRGLSIGFKPIEASRIKDTFSQRFVKWLWLELSAVTIAMNGEATITAVKQFDVGLPADEQAALGDTLIGSPLVAALEARLDKYDQAIKANKPAALGNKPVRLLPPGGSGLHKPNPQLRIIV